MKKENLDKLNGIENLIKNIIVDEVGDIGIKYQESVKENQLLKNEKSKLEKENKQLCNIGKDKLLLIKLCNVLVKDGLLEVEEEGDTWCDEYGNGGGFHRFAYKYKGEIMYEEGQSF